MQIRYSKVTENFQHTKMKVKKFSILKERIRLFAECQNISIREIYEKTGISDGTFSNSSGLNEESLLKLFNYFNYLDANWLLTGQGSMIKENDASANTSAESDSNTEEKYILELQKKMIQKLETEVIQLKQERKNS